MFLFLILSVLTGFCAFNCFEIFSCSVSLSVLMTICLVLLIQELKLICLFVEYLLCNKH